MHFYLMLYGVQHKVKYHMDKERRNLLPPFHGLLFLITSKISFICIIPLDRKLHIMAFITPVVEHWMERELAQYM